MSKGKPADINMICITVMLTRLLDNILVTGIHCGLMYVMYNLIYHWSRQEIQKYNCNSPCTVHVRAKNWE